MTELQRLHLLLDYFNEQAKQSEKEVEKQVDAENHGYWTGKYGAFSKAAFMIQCQIEQLEQK